MSVGRYVDTCLYVLVCVSMGVHQFIRTHMNVCISVSGCENERESTRVYMTVRVYVFVHTCMSTTFYVLCVRTCVLVYVHSCIYR